LLRRRKTQNGQIGLSLGADFGALAHVEGVTSARPVVRLCEAFIPNSEGSEAALAEALRQRKLEGARCVGVLSAEDYNLLQIEPPAVPEAELRDAVRWQVKDFLDVPVAEAMVDVFSVPDRPRQKPMAYAVAAARRSLLPLAEFAARLRLDCRTIDIPELALRNLVNRMEGAEAGLACLYLGRRRGHIVIVRENSIYLARQISVGCEQLAAGDDTAGSLEALTLDIQRSLDYFESSVSRMPVRRVVVCPLEVPVHNLLATLDRQLAPAVGWLNPHDLLEIEGEIDETELSRCLLAVGAALRVEG